MSFEVFMAVAYFAGVLWLIYPGKAHRWDHLKTRPGNEDDIA